MRIACGRCVGCLLDRSKAWAARCVHEAQLHAQNCFVTLTYSVVPPGGSLVKDHARLFIKRLRRRFRDRRISFFLCGEYGELSGRPHYHAILFGVDFEDKVPIRSSSSGTLYRSEELARLWGHGYASLGAVSFESAGYCARYVLKKVLKDVDAGESITADGEVVKRQPEYLAVSLRPGVGKRWIERFGADVYPDDFVVMDGRKVKVPRYYDKVHQVLDVDGARQVELERIERAARWEKQGDATGPRLGVREEVATARLRLHGRCL